jgi:hypothetical protein
MCISFYALFKNVRADRLLHVLFFLNYVLTEIEHIRHFVKMNRKFKSYSNSIRTKNDSLILDTIFLIDLIISM